MRKKNKWRLRRFMRWFYRNYKGMPDVFGIMLFVIGVVVIMSGAMLLMIAEPSCIIALFFGFSAICIGCDILSKERRRYGQ